MKAKLNDYGQPFHSASVCPQADVILGTSSDRSIQYGGILSVKSLSAMCPHKSTQQVEVFDSKLK
jgi:hypothetical protein